MRHSSVYDWPLDPIPKVFQFTDLLSWDRSVKMPINSRRYQHIKACVLQCSSRDTMANAGTLGVATAQMHLQPTYKKFEDMEFDVTSAKRIMSQFISEHCKTRRCPEPPFDPGSYNLQKRGADMLVMIMKNDGLLEFLVDINKGTVYVLQLKQPDEFRVYWNQDLGIQSCIRIYIDRGTAIIPELLKDSSNDHCDTCCMMCGRTMQFSVLSR